jgi:hypothetical protein
LTVVAKIVRPIGAELVVITAATAATIATFTVEIAT